MSIQIPPNIEPGCRLSALFVLSSGLALAAAKPNEPRIEQTIAAHIVRPQQLDASAERIATLKVPPGFAIGPFAEGLKNARILEVSDQGYIYVSRREQGDVLLLKDVDQDGRADGPPIEVAHRAGAHGIAAHGNRFFLATVKEVFAANIRADGRLAPLQMLVGNLPDGGQHANRTLELGPDGMLYVSVGSTCNACNESNPESAALLRLSPDGKSRTIVAGGLRNTIGFDWQPGTGQLWGMDHGIDFLGDGQPPEELNAIDYGKQYGWPHVFGKGDVNSQTALIGGLSKEDWQRLSTPMKLGYTAHAAPMQMVFYRGGSFPDEFRGDAFVTMHGSWNRSPPSGYEVVRVRFRDGNAISFEPFVTGFLVDDGRGYFGRPVGLATLRDGSLLVADDSNGVLYRIAYLGDRDATTPSNAGATRAVTPNAVTPTDARRITRPNSAQPKIDSRSLSDALRLSELDRITLSSPTIRKDAPIPKQHGEYANGVSPALSWTAVPRARSYAIVMEDPDAKAIRPFVHWVIWNIPASVTSLPEGLQEQLRLTEPDGVLQGRTSRGSVGYFGPRPPAEDTAHRYQFNVLALDSTLSLPPGSTREQFIAASQGHVMAWGQLVGLYDLGVSPMK